MYKRSVDRKLRAFHGLSVDPADLGQFQLALKVVSDILCHIKHILGLMQEELLRSDRSCRTFEVVVLLIILRNTSGYIGTSGIHIVPRLREGTAFIGDIHKIRIWILADQFACSAVIPILIICAVISELRRCELIKLKVRDTVVGTAACLRERTVPCLGGAEILLIRDIDLHAQIIDQLLDDVETEIPALVAVVLPAVVIRVDPDIAAHLDLGRCDRHFHLVAAQRIIGPCFVRCTGR